MNANAPVQPQAQPQVQEEMFDLNAFLEESKQPREVPVLEHVAAQNTISIKFLDVLTHMIASPYFIGRRHKSHGMIDMEDEFLDNNSEEKQNRDQVKKSLQGQCTKFSWTYLSKKEMEKHYNDPKEVARDAFGTNTKARKFMGETFVPLADKDYKLLADNKLEAYDAKFRAMRIDPMGKNLAGIHLCGMPISAEFLETTKKLLGHYQKFMDTAPMLAVFDDLAFESYNSDSRKMKAVVNIRNVHAMLQQALAVDPVTAEEMLDIKYIHFCGLSPIQHFGEEKPLVQSAFVAAVETFCDVPFRLCYYTCGAESFAFTEFAMTQREGKSDTVTSYFISKSAVALQPACNKWNRRMSEDGAYAECAARLIIKARQPELPALKDKPLAAATKALLPFVLPSVQQCCLFLQEQMWASSLVCYPYKMKGQFVKDVLATGTEVTFPQMHIAREAFRRQLKPALVKGFKIGGEEPSQARPSNERVLEDLFA